MIIIFRLFATLAILSTQSNALNVPNSAKKCRTLSSDDVKHFQCGELGEREEQFAIEGRIHNPDKVASAVKQGEFPWSAVLMMKTRSKDGIIKWKYFCGGTLINSVNVLTAAHCIQPKGSTNPLKAENMKVLLGAHNISDTTEPCRKEFEVDSYLIHSGWDSDDQFKFTDDIALLRLKGKIEEFSSMIFPICLKKNAEIVNVKSGTISGYGEFNKTRLITSDVPLKVELPIVEAHDWVNSKHRKLAFATWNESFVAGSENVGVCPGDSGSGFYVKSNGKFYLRGLVSSAIIDGDCTSNNFALYTDMLKYLDDFVLKFSQAKFITKECGDYDSANSGCVVNVKPAEEFCTDEPVWIKLQHNELSSLKILKMQDLLFTIDRQSDNEVFCLPHLIDAENLVKLILFGDGLSLLKFTATDSVLNMLRNLKLLKRFTFSSIEFKSIAKNFLTKNFQIEELEIYESDILNLSAEMLINLPMLKILALDDSNIKTIPEDFFSFNHELESIRMYGNQITVLPQNLLKNLSKLRKFEVRWNYKITSIPDNFFADNHELESIEMYSNQITQLPENLLKNLKKLTYVSFSDSQITSIPDNFFSDNEKLEEIDFRGNKISELPRTLLKGLTESLRKIYLWNNPIKAIPGSSFFTENEELRNKINLKDYRWFDGRNRTSSEMLIL